MFTLFNISIHKCCRFFAGYIKYEQVLKHRFGENEADLKQLKKRILNENPTQGLDWLLEKIAELEAK